MARIVIDPVTRIEGHLKIEAVTEGGVVREARCSGTLFRGLETILRGRNPLDASRITQRICGVCPTAHALASSLALDDALGLRERIPRNGRLLRNLILGSNYIQSHILHFYHLAALDYVDVTAAAGYRGDDPHLRKVERFLAGGGTAPFLPRYEGDYRLSPEQNRAAVAHYVEALDRRREAQEMLAIFGGKMPHSMGIFPGGALDVVTVDKIAAFRFRLERLRRFVEDVYLPDVLAVAKAYPDYLEIGRGPGRFLTYGGFEPEPGSADAAGPVFPQAGTLDAATLGSEPLDSGRIQEHVENAWYTGRSPLHPEVGSTEADARKGRGYSFVKAPRYDGAVHEVGPLGRALMHYAAGDEAVRGSVDAVLAELGAGPAQLPSVLGRHAARALECRRVADAMAGWLLALEPEAPACAEFELPDQATGAGLVDVPRGSLGHWIEIRDGVIANYQAIAPTTWNCSPRDDAGQPGPCEQALEGTRVRDAGNPFELVRIVRSYDPCMACAIHLVTPRGREIGRFRVA